LQNEAQEGLDGSYRDFYLMENPRCGPSDAEAHMRSLITREWEELNRECLCRRTFSTYFTQACLNITRMISVMYSYSKEHRLLVLEDYARMLLHENPCAKPNLSHSLLVCTNVEIKSCKLDS
jgi:(3S)-linalool synthase